MSSRSATGQPSSSESQQPRLACHAASRGMKGHLTAQVFSILAKVVDDKVTYLQFLEDSYAHRRQLPQGRLLDPRRRPAPGRSRSHVEHHRRRSSAGRHRVGAR
jgi:hypothetical protein